MIGRAGGVGQDQVGLALQEQAIGFGPAGGDGDDVVGQCLPDLIRPVAMRGLDPHQQPKARGGRPGVLDHDLEVGGGQRVEGPGRFCQTATVVDKGEPAPIEGQEQRVVEGDGQVGRGHDPMRGEKPGRGGGGGQVGVEAKDDVGL